MIDQKTDSGKGWLWATLGLLALLLLGFGLYATSDSVAEPQADQGRDTTVDSRDMGVDVAGFAGENIPGHLIRVVALDDGSAVTIATVLGEEGGIEGFCVFEDTSDAEAERAVRAFVADGHTEGVQASAWSCHR